ncbi:hypothetical protein [Nesterenkonia lutea]|uniref:Ketohydroxyglutarate aldolase n=1 Tax=Nesterenkonia lutea TaxID=272919 RepID=A0ABR9JC26_9MICC|nr:hypothetical protein [Nesterenkonia lutea]MBE1523333.1 hypothetical protein [Nesterenkonia lutea]
MSAQQWIITVDDDHLDAMDEVVAELREAGLVVDKVLRSLGQITGYTEEPTGSAAGLSAQADRRRPDLSAVTGVASADGARRHNIAPPDAEVQ